MLWNIALSLVFVAYAATLYLVIRRPLAFRRRLHLSASGFHDVYSVLVKSVLFLIPMLLIMVLHYLAELAVTSSHTVQASTAPALALLIVGIVFYLAEILSWLGFFIGAVVALLALLKLLPYQRSAHS